MTRPERGVVRQVLLAVILLPSCNALFGIEEGRPYPADASSAGSSGSAGSAGSNTVDSGGTAGDASADGADGAVDSGSDGGDATDASVDVCPLITDCGSARSCWCGKCRLELDKCVADAKCKAALECLLRSDCGPEFLSCQGTVESTCPAYCTDFGANVTASFTMLQPIADCAKRNPECSYCSTHHDCTGVCPVIMPAHNQPVPQGCPPGGPTCHYESRSCQCLSDRWSCT